MLSAALIRYFTKTLLLLLILVVVVVSRQPVSANHHPCGIPTDDVASLMAVVAMLLLIVRTVADYFPILTAADQRDCLTRDLLLLGVVETALAGGSWVDHVLSVALSLLVVGVVVAGIL